MSDQTLVLSTRLAAARGGLIEAKHRFELVLSDEEVAAEIRDLTSKADALKVLGLHNLARDFQRLSVDWKRRWGKDNPATGEGKTGRPRKDGKVRTSDVPTFSKRQKEHQRALAAVPEAKVDEVFARAAERGDVPSEAEILKAADRSARRNAAEGGGEVEWYTPPELIEAARTVMGSIDLDPASCEVANRTVQATEYFSVADDGLERDWHGHVWLNPPFKASVIRQFAAKLGEELAARRVDACCWLSPTVSTETTWMQELLRQADALCLLSGRVKYVSSEGVVQGSSWADCILYFGDLPDDFGQIFHKHGVVYERAHW